MPFFRQMQSLTSPFILAAANGLLYAAVKKDEFQGYGVWSLLPKRNVDGTQEEEDEKSCNVSSDVPLPLEKRILVGAKVCWFVL